MSVLGTPVAGDIEDTYTNFPLVAERLGMIADNMGYIYSLELLHAAQAINLRKNLKGDFKIGKGSEKLYKDYRSIIPYVNVDRVYTTDIEKDKKLIMGEKR